MMSIEEVDRLCPRSFDTEDCSSRCMSVAGHRRVFVMLTWIDGINLDSPPPRRVMALVIALFRDQIMLTVVPK